MLIVKYCVVFWGLYFVIVVVFCVKSCDCELYFVRLYLRCCCRDCVVCYRSVVLLPYGYSYSILGFY